MKTKMEEQPNQQSIQSIFLRYEIQINFIHEFIEFIFSSRVYMLHQNRNAPRGFPHFIAMSCIRLEYQHHSLTLFFTPS